MRFLFYKNAGEKELELSGDELAHIKARRLREDSKINLRNLKDGLNHIYKINNFTKKGAILELISSEICDADESKIDIAWGVVEPKIIEKTLPFLNEFGVRTLFLVFCDFSQKNFKLDLERMNKILTNSSGQCGRNGILKIEIFQSLDKFLSQYPNTVAIDFGGEVLKDDLDSKNIFIIGPEGGFSASERDKIKHRFSLRTEQILRSESAILGVCAKIIL